MPRASGVIVDTQLFLRAEAIIDEALGRVETRLAQERVDRRREPLGLVEHDEMFADRRCRRTRLAARVDIGACRRLASSAARSARRNGDRARVIGMR